MKKTFIALSAILLWTFLTWCSTPNLTNMSLVKPLSAYELDTWGSNSEVYEFTPKNAPNTLCIVYILDNLNSTSMQCFTK